MPRQPFFFAKIAVPRILVLQLPWSLFIWTCETEQTMTHSPPLAPRRRFKRKSPQHLPDPWQWLENAEGAQTIKYLKDENAYYEAMMQPHALLRDQIFEELKGRVAEDDSSIPEKDGDFWYYVRFEKGQQYPLYCRKRGDLEAPEEIYLDHNEIAAQHEFCELGFVDVSPDHRYLAYCVDTQGEESYTIYLKDLMKGLLIDEPIENASSCFEWKGTEGFFYVLLDEHDRPNCVKHHHIGHPLSEDRTVYQEKDSSFFVGLDSSESDAYIFIVCHAYDSSETYAHAIDSPDLQLQLIEPRRPQHEYDVTHHGESFLILTNHEAENFRLVSVSIHAPRAENWQTIVESDPNVLLEGLIAYESFIVVAERLKGKPRLRVLAKGGSTFFIENEEEAYELSIAAGRDYRSESFRYWYSSPREPQTLFEYSLADQSKTVLKRRLVPDKSFSSDHYEVKRIWAPARDGASIPVTLIYRKNLTIGSPQPMVIHGYGSYGEIVDCDFSSYRLSLVDRGFVYAMAHVRGGMDLGRQWYLQGKLQHKWNSFNDFIDVTEYLIASGWTEKRKVIAEGSSAGGMLMGVIANERPDLYLGIVASVPFIDVLNTMLDPELPLTTLEYNEWGHPGDPRAYDLIKSYAPYENVKPQDYPHLLVVASLHDKRVMYWEAAKWVAKLRVTKTDQNLLLLKVDLKSGHGGASGRYDSLRELAEELCFMIVLKEKYIEESIKKE